MSDKIGVVSGRHIGPAKYVENMDGVHLVSPFDDHTLCGDTMDGDDHPAVGIDPPWSTGKRVVTCRRCVAIILHCRGVRIGGQGR